MDCNIWEILYLEPIEVKDVTDKVGYSLEYRFVHFINTNAPEKNCLL